MKTICRVVTNRQVRYLKTLERQWKASGSFVLREVIAFHMLNFTTSGGTMPTGTSTHTDGDEEGGDAVR